MVEGELIGEVDSDLGGHSWLGKVQFEPGTS